MVKFMGTPMNMLTMVVRLCEPKKNNTGSIYSIESICPEEISAEDNK